MARPVEITIPQRASGNARASIPEHAVPRIAAALRNESRVAGVDVEDEDDNRTDEELIADTIIEDLRERVLAYEQREAVQKATEDVADMKVDF